MYCRCANNILYAECAGSSPNHCVNELLSADSDVYFVHPFPHVHVTLHFTSHWEAVISNAVNTAGSSKAVNEMRAADWTRHEPCLGELA